MADPQDSEAFQTSFQNVTSREPTLPDRLKAGTPGLGEAAATDIDRRALELAHIDGRAFPTDADLDRAAAELASSAAEPPAAPETRDPKIASLTAWDAPADESGHRVGRVPLEDEGSMAERLVQDGMEEAEHDRRVAATDSNREG